MHRIRYWVLALLLAATATSASAQQSGASRADQAEIERPAFEGEISLRPRGRAQAEAEQWWGQDHDRNVRNVTQATLIPVLPAPERATGAAVIVAPGGAFQFLVMDNEGLEIARWLADNGVAAFVLKYRTDPTPRDTAGFTAALFARLRGVVAGDGQAISNAARGPELAREDAEAAVRLIRSRSATFGIDPNRIGVMGFSAGAITTVAVGLTADPEARPNFIAPIYGSLEPQDVGAEAPPMFLAIALDDGFFAQNKPLGLVDSWRAARRPVEVHLYERGGHGFASATSGAASLWRPQFLAWLQDRGVLRAR